MGLRGFCFPVLGEITSCLNADGKNFTEREKCVNIHRRQRQGNKGGEKGRNYRSNVIR